MASLPALLAHLVSTGVGPFYDGVAHFLVSLEELLPVLVLSLLGGLRGPRAGRQVLVVLPLAWVVGGCVGLWRPLAAPPVMLTTALLIVPAALVAWDRTWPPWLVNALTALFGLWTGWLNGSALASGGGFLALLGAVCAVVVVATLATGLAASLRAGWPRIVLRVAGSWVAALALLALGWTFKGQ